ncbi:MAG: NAD-dependent epimerase/dehydratase [Candidatus Beckwithbacteria bacterium GW2011_GWC2_47_9]|uniref:NAD-dependent epimerase/dehydratase n=1 Tax=Candidatus Beckwithbacteria bacterium GW2011_GWC2_47_9 TaxID=1618373 RepID=A0A0G1U157_9BACT|nr:MAG: NAD-dependent epimerase/dehydratase [Candidatus Beckwithbacteria bacterium GW2011_GWC2_47_9]
MSKNRVVLITGHAGFIGSHLTRKLLDLGFSVVGVDNYNDFYSPEIKAANVDAFRNHPNFKEYKLDILDRPGLECCFAASRPEIVIHLAARAGVRPSLTNPQLYRKVNVTGTKNLLELAKKYKVKQFIFASSSSVYGNQTKTPFSEANVLARPVSPYAETKLAAENLCKQSRLPVTILRFFTVYGPNGRPDMAPYLFTKAILNNQPIIRYGDGSTKRDYTYIDDIVSGIIAAIQRPFKFEVINLGNNHPVSLNDFIKTIEIITGKTAKIIEKPRHLADVPLTFADINKAQRLLAWRPKTDLKTGLEQFIDSYLKSAK